MKKFILVILCLCVTTLLGCTVKEQPKASTEENVTKEQDVEKQDIKKSSFKVIKPEFYTENIKSMIENMKEKRGFIEYANDDNHYILIFAGKKNTGGFGIDVLEAYDKGDHATIVIKEIIPDTKSSVTQAITYPSLVIKVTKAFKGVDISTESGEKFQKVEAGEKY